jgi:hypothetical protein
VLKVLNRANFRLPDCALFIRGAVGGTGVINPNAGRITSNPTTPRQMQLAVKFVV